MIFSEQQKINQSFNGTYTDIVNVVMEKYLNVNSSKLGVVEKSKGLHTVIIPNLSPFDTMNWLCKRAVNEDSLPSFLFFENKYGYNFVSLKTIVEQKTIMDINFSPKNVQGSENEEFRGARDLQVIGSNDLIENIKNGVYAGKFIGIDPLTRKVSINQIDYNQTYSKAQKHLNKYPNFTAALNREGKDSSEMFNSKIWQINQPIVISKIYNELDRVDGVQSVTSVRINNLYDTVSGYSGNVYDITAATKGGIVYPSLDASIFEVKYPNNDIIGKVVSL